MLNTDPSVVELLGIKFEFDIHLWLVVHPKLLQL